MIEILQNFETHAHLPFLELCLNLLVASLVLLILIFTASNFADLRAKFLLQTR